MFARLTACEWAGCSTQPFPVLRFLFPQDPRTEQVCKVVWRFRARGTHPPPRVASPENIPAPSKWLLVVEIKLAVLSREELKGLFIPEFEQMHCWLKRCDYFPFASSYHPVRVSLNRATATLAASPHSPACHFPKVEPFLSKAGGPWSASVSATPLFTSASWYLQRAMRVAGELLCFAVSVPPQLSPPRSTLRSDSTGIPLRQRIQGSREKG